jgi:hypothetical protein
LELALFSLIYFRTLASPDFLTHFADAASVDSANEPTALQQSLSTEGSSHPGFLTTKKYVMEYKKKNIRTDLQK